MSQILNVRNLIEPDQSASVMAAAPSSLVLDIGMDVIGNDVNDVTGEIINSVANQQQQQQQQQSVGGSTTTTQPATSAQTSVIQENVAATGSGSPPKRTHDGKNETKPKRLKGSVSASFVVNLDYNKETRLETRLHDILCCKVCLDLPLSSIFQVFFIFCYKFSIHF